MLLLAVGACGRFGFGEHTPISDGNGHGDGDGSDSTTIDAPAAPFVPPWKSGTRIRARVLTVGDGSDPIWYGWHDLVTGTDCQSAVSADGLERCMPAHALADQYFSDASCTTGLGWTHGLCNHDSYGYSSVGVVIHVFPFASVFTGQAYTVNGGCVPATPSSGQLYSLGAEEPAATFAITHYTQRPVGMYTHLFLNFGDGSEKDLGALSFSQASCTPTSGMASGTTPCKPAGEPVLVPVYLDSGCTQRGYYSAAGDIPTEFTVNTTALCGVAFDVYEVSANVTVGQYWTLGPGGCTMQATGAGTLFTASAADPYPHGLVGTGERRGRIGYLNWTTSDGVAMPLAEWDFQLGHTCRPFVAEDGVVRCLPRTPKEIMANTDAACTSSLATVAADCYGAAPVDGVGYASCDDGPVAMHTLSTVPATYYDNEATCTSLGSAYDTTTSTGTIPPSTFAALTEMIE
jgi:hypothetical protein